MRTIVKTPHFRSLLDSNFYPTSFGNALEELYGQSKRSVTPAVNVRESDENYHLDFLVPGFRKEEIKVELEEKTLSIFAEHQTENEKADDKFIRKEFSSHTFKRTFTLPENIEKEGLTAKYENGILHVILPKKNNVKVETKKNIEIQ
jgi:HSP20 family protein